MSDSGLQLPRGKVTVWRMAKKTAGERVRAFLEANGKTQAWLADELQVARESVWRWLEGQRTPGAYHAGRIADLTGVEVTAWPVSRKVA